MGTSTSFKGFKDKSALIPEWARENPELSPDVVPSQPAATEPIFRPRMQKNSRQKITIKNNLLRCHQRLHYFQVGEFPKPSLDAMRAAQEMFRRWDAPT